ncbi:MAG: hypothetical protein IT353_07815 [Gemmatimonadaceae bacterium]|nr:hypothetical protein [Gemmatimonadaceae bacterium]
MRQGQTARRRACVAAGAALLLLSVLANPALAQSLASGQWGLYGEAGAVTSGTWVAGRGAPDVVSTVGPALSLGARRSIGPASSAGVAVRLLSQPLSVREGGASWSGGSLIDVQPMLTLATNLPRRSDSPVGLEAGIGVSVLSGAGALYPFSNAERMAPIGDLSLAYAFSPRRSATVRSEQPDRPLALVVRYSVLRFDPGIAAGIDANSSESGWVGRISVGIRVQR